ncbi:putative hydrolase [Knoellia remsis]|uniref:Putative hydrolase n=1 Tax=Knoellia remsis TaxID=407159 RepID=A0A2T0UYN1_9MICO|nr:zinc-dependent metalloprotease [Knoellia remsis]PRY62967.1 putative hydrolase [Knoellia remsis]
MSNSPDRPDEPEDSGLPPELEQVLRGLTGGRDLDPQMVEMMRGMGLDQVDPQMLQMVAGQVQQMFAGSGDDTGSVDLTVATDMARRTASADADPVVAEADSAAVRSAVDVAGLWLDAVTDLDHSGLVGRAWSRAEWVEATMPVWRELVDPIAVGVSAAMDAALTKQLGALGEQGLPEGMVPPGMNPAAMMGQMAPMLRRMQGSMFSVQLGQAVGTLSGEILTGDEVSLPLVSAPDVVLMPAAVAQFADGLDIDLPQARLLLAVRETARTRLFHAVPWIGPQLLTAVQDYARDTSIDTDAIEEGLRTIDPSDPEAMQQALSGRLFAPQQSPAQKAALARLETLLALVEGWVDVVTAAAVKQHLPQAEALGEAVRRRRASGGPAEKTFAALVGLELRPRRLRDAANLFAALESAGGAELRDGAWAHPDVAPDASDLDDVLGYVERVRARSTDGDDLDAELDALLRGEPGDDAARGDEGRPGDGPTPA